MAMWERHTKNACPKVPSFSSSLLDSIYRSIDDTRATAASDHRKPPVHRRNKPEADDVESLRRAIMIEKWIDNYSSTGAGACTSTPRHLPSNSASSTDSSVFSSSDSASSSASKTSPNPSLQKLKTAPTSEATASKAKTKIKTKTIYGELKKAKEPISPGGKISSFFNSIFSPRNPKTGDECSSIIRKSRSMKEAATCSLTSRSCLSKNASSRASKSKRTVRFCNVNAIVGHDRIYDDEKGDDFRVFESKNSRRNEVRGFSRGDKDSDDVSCSSSDLFELENIGRVEIGGYDQQELPLYETTQAWNL